MKRGRLKSVMFAGLACVGLGGCASAGPAELVIDARQYPAAFDAARDALRDRDYALQRVDAAAGVLSTDPKASAGLAWPWDQDQSTPTQEVDELFDRRGRAVRVVFEPAAGPGGAGGPGGAAGAGAGGGANGAAGADLRDYSGPLVMRVRVALLRVQRPGWRVDSTSVRLSGYSSDPALAQRGLEPGYRVAFDEDRLLAGKIAAQVRERLAGLPASAPEPAPAAGSAASATREP